VHALAELYVRMAVIRQFEEAVLELAARGEIPGVIHPYTGHEAVAVGALASRRSDEWVIGYYRCHGHAIASGSLLEPLLREMLDREGAVCGGKSGSMQLCSHECRFLLASSIVGSQLAIAAGVAFREKAEGTGQAVTVFIGDGALGAGIVYETIMIARRKCLPLFVVCEDNGWQDQTVSSSVMPLGAADLLQGLGLPVSEVDGNEVEEVAAAARRAREDCQSGRGPVAIVAKTYLRDFHSQLKNFTPGQYRPEDEVQRWRLRDPLDLAERHLKEQGVDCSVLARRAETVVRTAVENTLAAPPLKVERALQGVTVAPWSTVEGSYQTVGMKP
jgi:acetoin:2,6-dichlorophenolindophenol oxidoreductase subunit alpha